MIDGIFEAAMLMCFAAAWPFSIYRSWKSRTSHGKSLFFMLIVVMGYIFGIMNKFLMNDINYVLAFYVLDMALVCIDVSIYLRNRHLDKVNGPPNTLRI
jgi:hypothetical protein